MQKLWMGWKNVAHLGAAYFHLWDRRGGKDLDTDFLRQQLPLFLRLAKRFEEFGTSFRPHPTDKSDPILDQTTVWRVPVNAGADNAEMPAGLSLAAQTYLASYTAPTRLR
jgi:hypothetical protein